MKNSTITTYYFIRIVVAAEVIIEVGRLVDVETGVDLNPELLPVRVVELSVAVVDLDRLTLPSPPQFVFAVCITDGRLQMNEFLLHIIKYIQVLEKSLSISRIGCIRVSQL